MAQSKTLLSLPNELLAHIPHHLSNIEDFKEASSTCRRLRETFAHTHPNTILRLAAASSRVFFRPDPYFLVAATASQVGEWALNREENAQRFKSACREGIEGLFELCVEVAGLTMEDIRWLHTSRFTIFNPAIDLIDRVAGHQWYDVEDFWSGGRSDAETIDCEPERALFEIAIYGALFLPTLEANLAGRNSALDLTMRLEFLKYCIPDWYCKTYPGSEVDEVGPFKNGRDAVSPGMDMYSLRHILKSRKWNEAWAEVRGECGGEKIANDEDGRKQAVWDDCVYMHGLAGFEMLRPRGVGKFKGRLLELRERIQDADFDKMKAHDRDVFGEIEWRGCPDLPNELFFCIRAMWPYYNFVEHTNGYIDQQP